METRRLAILLATFLPLSAMSAAPTEPGAWKRGDPVPAALADEIDELLLQIDDRREVWRVYRRLEAIGPPAAGQLEDALFFAETEAQRRIVTLLSRIEGNEKSPMLEAGLSLTLPDAVADLRHDAVRWNAIRAMDYLRKHRSAARPLLERVLDSPDHQQRQLAASLLRGVAAYRPTTRMLAVTIEGLRDDVLPLGKRPGEIRRTGTGDGNATSGVRWFLRDRARIRAAAGQLRAALDADDGQQRFLAAYLLGIGGRTAAAEEIFVVLAPHLCDNAISGDANMAAAAIHGLGPVIIPALRARLPFADRQEADLLRLVLHHLAGADDPDAALLPASRRRTITTRVHDPVLQHRFDTVPRGL